MQKVYTISFSKGFGPEVPIHKGASLSLTNAIKLVRMLYPGVKRLRLPKRGIVTFRGVIPSTVLETEIPYYVYIYEENVF